METKIRNFLFGLFLIAISILLFLGLLELALGLFNPQISAGSADKIPLQYDENLGWINIPNAEGFMKDFHKEYSVNIKINSKGFRDSNYTYEKPQGVKRIIVLGDSQTWGTGVESYENFPSILNNSLKKVEVLNMGVGGYGTDQELLLLKQEGLKYTPDIVILEFTINNDVENNAQTNNGQGSYKPYFVLNEENLSLFNVPVPKEKYQNTNTNGFFSFKLYLREHTHTYPFIANRLMNTPSTRKLLVNSGIAGAPVPYHVFKLYAKDYTAQTNNEWNLTKKLLIETANIARENNASFLIVLVPDKEQVYEKYWNIAKKQFDMDDRDYVLSKPDDILKEFGKENNLTVLDLLPEFKIHANEPEDLYFKYDGHLNKKGHKLVAELIRKILIDENLLSNQ